MWMETLICKMSILSDKNCSHICQKQTRRESVSSLPEVLDPSGGANFRTLPWGKKFSKEVPSCSIFLLDFPSSFSPTLKDDREGMRMIPLGTIHPGASPRPQHPLLAASPDWKSQTALRRLGQWGTVTFAVRKGAEAGTRVGLSRRGPGLAEPNSALALGLVGRPGDGPRPPPPLLGEGAGAQERRGLSREEAEEEREAGRAGPAQELGGATHLCSRPAAPEQPESLAAPTRRSGHAPTPPPSSRLLLQLQPLRRHRRAQPGNHDGQAVRALTHLPPVSPPPPAFLP